MRQASALLSYTLKSTRPQAAAFLALLAIPAVLTAALALRSAKEVSPTHLATLAAAYHPTVCVMVYAAPWRLHWLI